VDVRPESPTYGDHLLVELSADNHRTLFLPPYVAHGFQTLTDDTEVSYQISGQHVPDAEQGFRWNEPEFAIAWPLPVTAMSEQDGSWPSRASELASANSGASYGSSGSMAGHEAVDAAPGRRANGRLRESVDQ
jgi:dTDP-4-dehydrorhamnose 3,5-epimerase